MGLKDMIAEEKKRRSKLEKDENKEFKIDSADDVNLDVVSEAKLQFDMREFPVHAKMITLAERMGMELRQTNEDGDHLFRYKNFLLYVNPSKETIQLEEIMPSGNNRQLIIVRTEDAYVNYFMKEMAFQLFLRDDKEARRKAESAKIAWNAKYARQTGEFWE